LYSTSRLLTDGHGAGRLIARQVVHRRRSISRRDRRARRTWVHLGLPRRMLPGRKTGERSGAGWGNISDAAPCLAWSGTPSRGRGRPHRSRLRHQGGRLEPQSASLSWCRIPIARQGARPKRRRLAASAADQRDQVPPVARTHCRDEAGCLLKPGVF